MTSRTWRSLLPSRSDYTQLRQSWRTDLLAGITVAIVALPLALAFGISSGVGAEAGLITAIIAGLVAAIFGGSNVQVSGPTGAMVVVLAPIVATYGVGSVALLSLIAGVLVFVAGLLRLGRAVSTIPWPVIEGFTVGIGIIIFLQQVPLALGVGLEGHSTNALIAAWQSVTEANWSTAAAPLVVVAAVATIMVVLNRIWPRMPASFIAIVAVSLGVVAVGALTGTTPQVATIGALPNSLPAPGSVSIDLGALPNLLGPAVAVAALAAIESLLSARVAATMADTGQVNPDRELVGQGLASIASGVFGGMPATGAIARTAVNVRAGARTRLSAIVHALGLLLVVLFAANVVSSIPLAALAGVLMVTASRMASWSTIREVMRAGRSDAAVFVVTALITVTFDLVIAVGIGIAAAAFFALRALSEASGVHREDLPGSPVAGDERIAAFRLDGSLFFGAAERIIEHISDHQGLEVVIVQLHDLQLIDATGAHNLTELVHALEARGVTVLLAGIRPEHHQVVHRLGVIDALRHPNHLAKDLAEAAAHARSHIARGPQTSTTGAA